MTQVRSTMIRILAGAALLLAPGAGQAAESYVKGLANTEDMAPLPGGNWVLASNMAGGTRKSGAIVAINARDGRVTKLYPAADQPLPAAPVGGCAGPVAADAFAPHGVVFKQGKDGAARLYVVNHGGRESVEIFDVDAAAPPRLRWAGCLVLPKGAFGNAVAVAGDGAVYVTNMAAKPEGATSPTAKLAGNVLGWRAATGWRPVPDSQISGPNGMIVSPDGKLLYVASWPEGEVIELTLGGASTARRTVKTAFLTDNLRWGADGAILAVGQATTAQTVMDCYVSPRDNCVIPSAAAVIDAATMTTSCARPVALNMATVAVNVGDETWIGTARGDSILRLPAGAFAGANCK